MQLNSILAKEKKVILPAAAEVEPLRWNTFDAPVVGTILLRWSDLGLRTLDFRAEGHAPDPMFRADFSAPLQRALTRYFAGEAEDFAEVALDLRGTDFQRRVWNALLAIPYGHVCSYAHIANQLGVPRGMRAVGTANGRNPVPIIVPCHRVIEQNGKLGGYSGGLDIKRVLLQLEGAELREGHVHAGQLGLFS